MVVTVKKLMIVQIIQWKSVTVINLQIFVHYDVLDDDDHDDSNNYNDNDAEHKDSNNDNNNNNT